MFKQVTVHVYNFRSYGLVPIAAEDYGDMSHTVKVVAAARKRDLYMTLFNLKSKCSPFVCPFLHCFKLLQLTLHLLNFLNRLVHLTLLSILEI